jgi:hypothetical protein
MVQNQKKKITEANYLMLSINYIYKELLLYIYIFTKHNDVQKYF